MDPNILKLLELVIPITAVAIVLGIGGSLLHTWLKIKNGYPLSNSWGMPMHPKADRESVERIWQTSRVPAITERIARKMT